LTQIRPGHYSALVHQETEGLERAFSPEWLADPMRDPRRSNRNGLEDRSDLLGQSAEVPETLRRELNVAATYT
jgi:hypothetical protein